MIDYNCACLVDIKDNKLLLVRVRDNEKFYLPGGKIEKDEELKPALIRELKEELDVDIHAENLIYLYDVIGDAYPDNKQQVKLNCFKSNKPFNDISAHGEITEIKYIDLEDYDKMAPAVIKLIEKKLRRSKIV
ncbi:NUDIX hydrolase [Macrococcus bovicus]|uniref:NUDIX hydrolase n=1 Tax=Macrococcus bovicus TaxID=69968 RepID=UPI0025A5E0D6|nr:NUDIX domain-containing protein [Macrococcus bovicus]WJP96764.1 NUDIX domain-containing protein [Macrococcus bovicus]